MHEFVEQRVKEEANYMIQSKATIRAIAKQFYVSKSTAYLDLSERLKLVAPELHDQVNIILQNNKYERSIRGGKATSEKYKQLKSCRTRNVLA